MKRVVLAALMIAAVASVGSAQILFNEFEANPLGTDPGTMTVELLGTPGASATVTIVSVESDAGTSAGLCDRVNTDLPVSFDGVTGIGTVTIPDLENPTFTLVLLSSFTGDTSTDIDADNDGTADTLGTFGVVYDAIGVPDTNGEPVYGAQLGGTDLAFIGSEPVLIFRDATTPTDIYATDGTNTDVYDAITGVQAGNLQFDMDPTVATYGAVNPSRTSVPVELQSFSIE